MVLQFCIEKLHMTITQAANAGVLWDEVWEGLELCKEEQDRIRRAGA